MGGVSVLCSLPATAQLPVSNRGRMIGRHNLAPRHFPVTRSLRGEASTLGHYKLVSFLCPLCPRGRKVASGKPRLVPPGKVSYANLTDSVSACRGPCPLMLSKRGGRRQG